MGISFRPANPHGLDAHQGAALTWRKRLGANDLVQTGPRIDSLARATDGGHSVHRPERKTTDFPMLVEMSAISSFEASMQKLRQYGEGVLAEAKAKALEAGIQADAVLREVMQGRVADIIVDEAQTAACDLIVMGTHGRRGFSRLALGSDADRVVRSSRVPVLLVRDEAADA
ncbi:universal stress protein [Variovorax sp. SRS16]|uniref:universal stress protein n=1 Tax=Variovorax sp. SRS16 TaxID=282217 RepID=UPI0013A5BDC3|nr:universal stress protein [Variovorax sp. SRS16]